MEVSPTLTGLTNCEEEVVFSPLETIQSVQEKKG
jgi:hypothetical protein